MGTGTITCRCAKMAEIFWLMFALPKQQALHQGLHQHFCSYLVVWVEDSGILMISTAAFIEFNFILRISLKKVRQI
jgi:hypothetical protein